MAHGGRWAAIAAGAMVCSGASGAVIFVDANLATGANDGSSWADAYQGRAGLQAALLSAMAGDQVWVADGTYAPAPPGGDASISHVIPSGVQVLGGFDGGEPSVSERDPSVHVAILTGDLNSDDGPFGDIGIAPNTGENAWHVVDIVNGAAGTVIDGFRIRSGVSDGGADWWGRSGGGIRIDGGEPTVRNCHIINCRCSWQGGGIAVRDATVVIEDCLIEFNRTDSAGAAIAVIDDAASVTMRGTTINANMLGTGSVYVGPWNITQHEANGGALTVEDCDFKNAQGIISAPSGGGIMSLRSDVVVRDSRFHDNNVVGGGGGAYLADGTVLIERCDFVNNEAPGDGGGGLYLDGDLLGNDPDFNPQIVNCRFVGNNGAAFVIADTSFINCTIVNNSLGKDFLIWAPLATGGGFTTTLTNCIMWANNPGMLFGPGPLAGSGSYFVHASIIQEWDGSHAGDAIDSDPLFVQRDGPDGTRGTVDDNVRLTAASPALDAGDNGDAPTGPLLDLDRSIRIIDGDHDSGITVDMGAFERPCLGDADANGVVTFDDLNIVLEHWGMSVARGTNGDVDDDGDVDFEDLNLVLEAWGELCL